jgi:signal transduction histidine kinase/DNA-binding response OmpR family regulator
MPLGATLLIIDDDAVTRETLRSLLAKDGYQFILAENGAEGLAQAVAGDPDVILLDVMMPGIDGFEVCRRLRRDVHLAEVPILMLSALEDRAARLEGLEVGADDFIAKPFDGLELRARLKSITRLNRYRRLEAERSKFQQFVEQMADGVVVCDATGRIIEWNQSQETITGLTKVAVMGRLIWEVQAELTLAAPETSLAIEVNWADWLGSFQTGPATWLNPLREQDIQRPDHTRCTLQTLTFPIQTATGYLVGIITRDITENKKAELERQRLLETLEKRVADRTHELSALYAVASVANEALDLQVMLDKMLARTLAAVGLPRGAIHFLDASGDQLHLVAQIGIPPAIETRIRIVTPGFGLAGWVVERNEPLTLTNVSSDPRILTIGQVSGYSVYLSAPLRAYGQVLGAISAFGDTEQSLNPETIALLTTIADQIGLAAESMRLRQQTKQAAVLEERQRVARELHDSVAQSLYSLTLLASAGQRAAQDGSLQRTRRHLDRIGLTAFQSLKEMRLLVYELQPSTLGTEDLVSALRRRLEVVEGHAHVHTELLVEGQIQVPLSTEIELYGIAQEALNNALKHALATTVTVRLTDASEGIVLEVSDNGQGFELLPVETKHGLGLTTMRARAARLGCPLEIVTAPGKGTSVKVKAPKPIPDQTPGDWPALVGA